MKKKVLSSLLALTLVIGALSGCGNSNAGNDSAGSDGAANESAAQAGTESETGEEGQSAEEPASETAAETGADFSGVSITMLNTKSEIQPQLEAAAEEWGALTGATLEVYTIGGDSSPAKEIGSRYAANNAPTLVMGDPQDVSDFCEEYGADLSGESWAANGGTKYGIMKGDVLYSFPFCIEARGLIYNRTAIEEILGEAWDPASVTNMDDLAALFERLAQAGMELPVALNMEDWSIAGHYLTQMYEEQDGTLATTEKFMEDLKAGTVDLTENVRFNAMMETFELLMKYNSNKSDPLAADYDMNAADLAEGEVAFWFNGNWAWAEISDYIEEGTELGLMPVVQNDTTGNANVNTYLCGGATKQVMIDKECNDEQQQAAAKNFLDWLVNSEAGQNVLVTECSLVPAISTITQEATNPLARSVQQYAAEGKLFDQPSNYPGDHWATVGAIMQKYLAGEETREEFAKEVQDYWTGLN